MSPTEALAQAVELGRQRLADMDAAARVAPPADRGQDAAAYFALSGYVREIEALVKQVAE